MPALKKIVVASSLTAVLAGKAEVTTSNLNGGSGTFDNLKASWGKALSIGDLKANLMAKYDYSKSKDFVEEISVTGDLMDDADLKVGYAVTRNFPNSATEVAVTATTKGTSVTALYDGELKVHAVDDCRACPLLPANALCHEMYRRLAERLMGALCRRRCLLRAPLMWPTAPSTSSPATL